MIEHRATKPLERHTLLVQHGDEDLRPRFLASARRRRAGRERSWWRNSAAKLCTKLCFVTINTLC